MKQSARLRFWFTRVSFVLFSLLFFSCEKEVPKSVVAKDSSYPAHFPEIEYPDDNQFTDARYKLGKKLFYDPILSEGNEISCSSCHKPELAFAHDQKVSPGIEGRLGDRNSPSLANIAFHPRFMRDGGVPTLEMQALVPIADHFEMGSNIVVAAERMVQLEEYRTLSQQAYERTPDPYVITRALACFQRTLISGNSPYDDFAYKGNRFALDAREIRGMNIFLSDKTQCSTCHSGVLFSSFDYANTGLYESYDDDGRYRLTLEEGDRSKFKIPSLRNVGLSAPYMHDGSMNTLSEVIDHYASGGANHPNKSDLIKGFEISEIEKVDLIAFLHTLTDDHFITDECHREE